MISNRIPDETAILVVRHLLGKHDLGQQLFKVGKTQLKGNGMAKEQSTIVDCTIIATVTPLQRQSPSAPDAKEQNQGAGGLRFTRPRRAKWYFGMKVEI